MIINFLNYHTSYKMVKKIFNILDKRQKIQMIGISLLIFVGAVLEMLGIAAILPVVYMILDISKLLQMDIVKVVYERFHLESLEQLMGIMIFATMVLYVFKCLILMLRNYIKFTYINKTQYTIASRMMEFYIYQPYLFHVNNNSSEIQRNIINDVGNFTQFLLAFLDLLVSSVLGTVLVIYLLILDILSTVSILGIFGISFLVLYFLLNKRLTYYGELSRTSGGMMIKWIGQSLNSIKEIKVLKNEAFFINKFNQEYRTSSKANRNEQFLGSLSSLIFEVVCIVSILLMVLVKLLRGDEVSDIITSLSMFAIAGMKLLSAINSSMSSITRMSFLKPSIEQLYQDLSIQYEKSDEPPMLNHCQQQRKQFWELKVENVFFRYPDMEKWILNNVSMRIKKGQEIGIIGPSGAGKTTFVDILLGILPLVEGKIEVEYDSKSVLKEDRTLFAYIPQTIYLIDDTIRNNIAYGMQECKISDEAIWEALEKAQLKDFVMSLDEGLDAVVGECGVKLSGGQRQRIGIARALYRKPEILILDEATSALDHETENAIINTLDNLYGKMTLIIIAHRLSTLRKCDCIYEIKDSKVWLKDKNEVIKSEQKKKRS